jgi:hypothetical protein
VRRREIASIAVAMGAVTVAAACSGGDDASDRADQGTSASAFDAGASLGEVAAEQAGDSGGSGGGRPGCDEEDEGAPRVGEATVGPVGDVDGDGREDQAWVGSGTRGDFGIATAAGGVLRATSSLSPDSLAVLVVDTDERAPVELLVSDGSAAEVWAFVACAVDPVVGPDGAPFVFDLTGDTGTGVGCADADGDGDRDLVGLDVTGDDGTTLTWDRTIIELDGLSATVGATDSGSSPAPESGPSILTSVACGDLTITDDGIASG